MSNLSFVLIFGAFHQVGGLISLCKNCVFNQNGFLDFSPRCAGTAGMDHPRGNGDDWRGLETKQVQATQAWELTKWWKFVDLRSWCIGGWHLSPQRIRIRRWGPWYFVFPMVYIMTLSGMKGKRRWSIVSFRSCSHPAGVFLSFIFQKPDGAEGGLNGGGAHSFAPLQGLKNESSMKVFGPQCRV